MTVCMEMTEIQKLRLSVQRVLKNYRITIMSYLARQKVLKRVPEKELEISVADIYTPEKGCLLFSISAFK